MPIVNYVREHMRFIEYAVDEKISSNERLLWYALMHIMNARATGNDWPGDFIPIDNDRVLMYCPMGFDAMARARNGLKQKGLIDFKPGNKNKASPMYKMNYLCLGDVDTGGSASAVTRAEARTACAWDPLPASQMRTDPHYPQKTDNMGDNIRGNMGDNTGDKTGDNMGDLYLNINKGYTEPYPRQDEQEQDEDDLYARAREDVFRAWAAHFGMKPAPAIVHQIANGQARIWQFGEGVIDYAIELAAKSGYQNPLGYITKTLGDWGEHYVHTRTEAEHFAMLHTAANGGMEYKDPMEALEEMRQFREEREVMMR